jgi:hypothetical protein
MVAYVTTNQLGVDLYAAYDAILTSLPEAPAHPQVYGSRVTATDGSEWIFGKVAAGATINRANCVTLDRICESVLPCVRGTASQLRGRRPGWYQGTTQLTAGMAAWFMISGAPEMLIAGQAAQPFVNLYTTDTSGVLSTVVATGSQFPIRGAHITVTQSGATASIVPGIATFPTIGALADAS